jgi:hypothetical protein
MSMELYILSDVKAPSIAAWQQAIDARGFDLQLSTQWALADLNGALPVRIKGAEATFECVHWDAAPLIAELAEDEIEFDRPWTYVLALRWGIEIPACVAAYYAAAGYADATGGVIFDCEEAKIISTQRAADIAREIDEQAPMIEAAVARVTAQYRS